MNLSVVIPSLGGDLCDTLDSINSSSVYPDEVIVCLPNDSHAVKNADRYENLSIIYAERYGQVYQRIIGFHQAKGDYICQVDDDLLLDSQCLEKLLSSLKRLPKASTVSPCLFNINGEPFFKSSKTILLATYYYLINGKNGYKPGGVTLAGTNIGVNPSDVKSNLVKVEWQPGGCVLHRRENLILKDFYPYKGKSYCEDLIHSFLLRQAGVGLYVNTNAKCTAFLISRPSLINELVPDFKIRLYFVNIAGLSKVRMLIHYVMYIIRSIAVNIVNKK
jgi:glycosyltransferase involved in cell wall biosynthesis